MNLDELYICKDEVEDEIDRVQLNHKKGKGELNIKEILDLLWAEQNDVSDLIHRITNHKNHELLQQSEWRV